ncbi:hypothetical protein [Palleronia sp. LCG004]|uniref:hypothetical protein n=1 Tax=Palleronia sp. LCG004 TaxID=3079304 RepID=UPI002941F585|nr:hypothetical protein [Palleronia sp. LCG004]WOI57479.1 hypothetical protein RVY76_06770 [Palleronia sp. LCG004]
MLRTLIAASFCIMPSSVSAQTMSAEDIARQIDERMKNLNPYEELLQDPDPSRRVAAMQIMLESGDRDLVRIATEYGLMAEDVVVQKAALAGLLESEPVLTMMLDASDADLRGWTNTLGGTATPEGFHYYRFDMTGYLEDELCYAQSKAPSSCFITLNSDGIFVEFRRGTGSDFARGKMQITTDGRLEGPLNLDGVSEPVTASIRLFE